MRERDSSEVAFPANLAVVGSKLREFPASLGSNAAVSFTSSGPLFVAFEKYGTKSKTMSSPSFARIGSNVDAEKKEGTTAIEKLVWIDWPKDVLMVTGRERPLCKSSGGLPLSMRVTASYSSQVLH